MQHEKSVDIFAVSWTLQALCVLLYNLAKNRDFPSLDLSKNQKSLIHLISMEMVRINHLMKKQLKTGEQKESTGPCKKVNLNI